MVSTLIMLVSQQHTNCNQQMCTCSMLPCQHSGFLLLKQTAIAPYIVFMGFYAVKICDFYNTKLYDNYFGGGGGGG